MTQDATTIVGVFDDYNTAESVARDLANAGIARDAIHVQSNFRTGAAGRSEYGEEHHEGGIAGFFRRLFGGDDADDDSGHYAEAVRRGGAVVTVTAPAGQTDRVAEIMNQGGATDIDRRVAQYQQTGYAKHDPNAAAYTYEDSVRERERNREGKSQEGASIPVIEEELRVGKRVIRKGGVRVYSRIVETPVERSIDLREEKARVERRPVNRPLDRAEAGGMKEQSIEVTETSEEPVIEKRAHVREEVIVGKETTHRTEQVRENVRRTEVKVEQLGDRGGDRSEAFRQDYEANYASTGEPFETMRPAYEYGCSRAGEPSYRGRNWSEVEEEMRTDYLRKNPNSAWDRVKGAIRYGWESVTGKR
jgi:uncharacterized protein (TIGR02271 family)